MFFYVVPQDRVAVIERFGKFQKITENGLHLKIPFIDKVVAKHTLRVLQYNIDIETKTKDDIFVELSVAVQYRVDKNNIKKVQYGIRNNDAVFKSYIKDTLYSTVPNFTLNELYEKKDEIVLAVQFQLTDIMSSNGHILVNTLITRIEPNFKVKQPLTANDTVRKRTCYRS